MLRTLSRKFSSSSLNSARSDEPDFASAGAVAHDRAMGAEADPRLERARERERSRARERSMSPTTADPQRRPGPYVNPLPTSAELPFYLDASLDALSLEPVEKLRLGGVRKHVTAVEQLTPPAPRRPSVEWAKIPKLPEPAILAASHLRHDAVVLRDPVPSIVLTPPIEYERQLECAQEVAPREPQGLGRRGSEPSPPREVTPIPRRPLMRRNAVSYRTERDVPLRVQAVRRAQQEAMARAMSNRPLLLANPRRATETALQYRVGPPRGRRMLPQALPPMREPPRGPLPPLPETQPLRIRRHVSAGQVEQAQRGRLARQSSARNRRDYFAEQPEEVRDFYLEAAMSSWEFPT